MLSKTTAKYIQSLQQKKFRDLHAAFVAEGPKVVIELLSDNIFECEHLFCTDEGFLSLSEHAKSHAIIIKNFELQKISSLVTSKDMLAVFKKKSHNQSPDLKNKLTLVLQDIRDPGNMGTIIRTADWFGIENIICSPETVDAYNTKVVQSTMASLGRVNIIYTDIEKLMNDHDDITLYAAVLHGESITSYNPVKEGFLLIGNESKGLPASMLKPSANLITIPKIGKAESLNAAVATGIILYALCGK